MAVEFTPYEKLSEQEKRAVDSPMAEDRARAAFRGLGLDVLISDYDPMVRTCVAQKGYGLDVLVNDLDDGVVWEVVKQGGDLMALAERPEAEWRVVAASRGYALDKLAYDDVQNVAVAARNYLFNNDLSLSDWCKANQLKCAKIENRLAIKYYVKHFDLFYGPETFGIETKDFDEALRVLGSDVTSAYLGEGDPDRGEKPCNLLGVEYAIPNADGSFRYGAVDILQERFDFPMRVTKEVLDRDVDAFPILEYLDEQVAKAKVAAELYSTAPNKSVDIADAIKLHEAGWTISQIAGKSSCMEITLKAAGAMMSAWNDRRYHDPETRVKPSFCEGEFWARAAEGEFIAIDNSTRDCDSATFETEDGVKAFLLYGFKEETAQAVDMGYISLDEVVARNHDNPEEVMAVHESVWESGLLENRVEGERPGLDEWQPGKEKGIEGQEQGRKPGELKSAPDKPKAQGLSGFGDTPGADERQGRVGAAVLNDVISATRSADAHNKSKK